MIEASDIKPAPYNPRKITEEELRGLKNSMDKFQDIAGIVFNRRTGNLISGHQRWHLLKEEYGENELVFVRIEESEFHQINAKGKGFTGYLIRIVDWDKSVEKAANVAANNPAIGGKFDMEILPVLLGEIEIEIPELMGDLRFDVLREDLGLNSIPPMDVEGDSLIDGERKKYLIEVQFPNEMEMQDVYDDLVSRGYIARVKN